jgi:DNA mismatch repair ATPase MutL
VAVRITSAPETADDPEAALVAAVEALMGGEDLAKALACKGSRQVGEELSRVEMERMLEEWTSCEFKDICPPKWKNRELRIRGRLSSGGVREVELVRV